jgi:hypothetical protein
MNRTVLLGCLALLTACKPSAGRGKEGVVVALLSPIGYAKVGDKRLVWSATADVHRYEVEVNDSTNVPVFKAVTADTSVVMPDSVKYSLTQNYRWFVTAYRDRDSTAWRSPVGVFRLEGEGRRMPPQPKE